MSIFALLTLFLFVIAGLTIAFAISFYRYLKHRSQEKTQVQITRT